MSLARLAYLLPLVALLGCASGPSMRPHLRAWKQSDDARSAPKPQATPAAQTELNELHRRIKAFDDPRAAQTPPSPTRGRMGLQIDHALQNFVAQRTTKPPPSDIPSPRELKQWDQILDQMDRSLDLQPTSTDLGALVRARVTLEVEMDRERQRHTAVPHELDVGYVQILAKIDRRVRELHASGDSHGFGGHIPASKDGLFLAWPLRTIMPSSPFGYRRDPINGRFKFHSGIDLVASPDTPVQAAAPGVVVFAAWSGGYGNYVVIEHAGGVRTHYAHLSHLFVSSGTVLDEPGPIGTVGSTGRSTGPHLHYSVSVHGRYVDPTLYTNTLISPDGQVPES